MAGKFLPPFLSHFLSASLTQLLMVTASSSTNKRRVVRRRDSSTLQLMPRAIVLIFSLSFVYFALSKSITSMQPERQRGHLRGRKVWVDSNSQLFVSRYDYLLATFMWW